MEKNIYSEIEEIINSEALNEETKAKLMLALTKLRNEKLNILITGGTGSGKSSTINAMFGEEVAKVGIGVDPETMEIEKYSLGNMILWDSPGLGDGKEADNKHAKNIIKKLTEKDENGNALIDLVLVILDGSSRDLGTSYELINNVIIPNLGQNREGRILVAINQADMAMKGRNWETESNRPNAELTAFLDAKAESIKNRIYAATGVKVEPIYYSAGYTDGTSKQNPYNLSKLYSYILKMTPKEKRLAYCDNINKDPNVWKDNDELRDYSKEIKNSYMETISEFAETGGNIGEDIGSNFGTVGRVAGRVVGTVVGGAVGVVVSIFRGLFS
ncbi:GTPase family protein [Ruminococcus flavefaciens]|uniref:GTPase family protein n=1 Tax=Ruminococcus flavefaciens TaxID=1265 RepID=UPI000463EAB4|nr:GTPase [Ruminococcus flavefaciens]